MTSPYVSELEYAKARIAELDAEVARLTEREDAWHKRDALWHKLNGRIAELEADNAKAEELTSRAHVIAKKAMDRNAELEAEQDRLKEVLRLKYDTVLAERNKLLATLQQMREVILAYVAPDARSIIAEIDAALCFSDADRLDAYADKLRAEAERD